MAEEKIEDKDIKIGDKTVGFSSIIKMNIKTAFGILSGISALIISILTYAYFDLKKDIDSSQKDFYRIVNERVEKIQIDVSNIRVSQEGIRGDIKLILDRQNRDNPILPKTYRAFDLALPPTVETDSIK